MLNRRFMRQEHCRSSEHVAEGVKLEIQKCCSVNVYEEGIYCFKNNFLSGIDKLLLK